MGRAGAGPSQASLVMRVPLHSGDWAWYVVTPRLLASDACHDIAVPPRPIPAPHLQVTPRLSPMPAPRVTAALRLHAAERPRALATADARESLDWAALLARVEAQADYLRR